MADKEKNIGSSKIEGTPSKPLKFILGPKVVKPENLADGCFDTAKIPDGSITEEKLADGAVSLRKLSSNIESALISLVMNDIRKIWAKIEDITGEQLQDLSFDVTPKYFISEEPVPVHISASSMGNNGTFDYIAFYINGLKVAEASGVDSYEFDTQISDTSEIKYEATILGNPYSASAVVVHYNSYWLGSGTEYRDVMDISHLLPITEGLRGSYDIAFNQNDRLYVILSRSLRDQFVRADMNGFEIPFHEVSVTIDDKEYCVLESDNIYREGTYNIDING